MSHLNDSISESNFDVNRPSTAPQTTSPFRSKSSINNRMQDHQSPTKQTNKKSPKHSAMSRRKQTQDEAGISTQTYSNSSVSNLTAVAQNLNISNDEVDQGDSSQIQSKKKDKRSREMKMPNKGNIFNVPQHSPTNKPHQYQRTIPQNSQMNNFQSPQPNPGHSGQTEYSVSVQDFFAMQISPLYNNTQSRYLENLSHHPQYQVANGMQQGGRVNNAHQYPMSVPNTPQVQHPQTPTSMSIPSSPNFQPEYNMSSKCFQNVMQHPLLSQSFNANFQRHSNFLNTLFAGRENFCGPVEGNQSPKHKRNRNKNKPGDIKYDAYLSIEEVEEGLKNNVLFEGVIRINPKQYQHSYVSSYDKSEQDVLIDGLKNRNRALEGDIVVVQYIESENEADNEENKQKRGKVVYIKEKVHKRTCIGNLKPLPDKNRQKALFVPRDHRMPRLNIPFTSWPDNFYEDHKNYENTLFLAKIIEWIDTRFAVGIILQNIGQSGDMITESKAILAQTDLDVTPYGPEVRHLYPRLDYTIPDEEFLFREDCRKLCLFSIDPHNCRDIDDAVSCRELENGNYEIGVHIADVAHFLTENTILDEKVAEKATTIYLVERAYHMLPDELCMLCSLFPGVDKLAFSVFWEINKEGEVLSHRFAKTVINSCAQLAYEHAQAILENKEDAKARFPEIYNNFVYNDLYKVIKALGSIAAIMRNNRFNGGALRIDQPKVAFKLNASNGLPSSFSIYENKESHQLIEEFMLLANMTVATRIREDHPQLAFLRCHPPPSAFMLKQLAKALMPMGIELDISSAGNLHRSMLPHVGPTSTDHGKAMVLNMLCAKPMARAKYFCADGCDDDDFHHYALNVPLYTHFTSPIRRYADIMVHRLLAASLNYRETPKWEIDHVRMVAAQCNKQKYNAKKAGEMSTELYTLKYIEMHSPMETEATVVDVREKYIDVIIIAMSLNRRIFFNNDFPGTYECIKHEGSLKLSKMECIWNATPSLPEVTQVIEVFSILKVELYKDEDLGKIDIRLVRPQ